MNSINIDGNENEIVWNVYHFKNDMLRIPMLIHHMAHIFVNEQ